MRKDRYSVLPSISSSSFVEILFFFSKLNSIHPSSRLIWEAHDGLAPVTAVSIAAGNLQYFLLRLIHSYFSSYKSSKD
jgi:hypothetical protein